jgi:hypothetical protein
MTFVHQGLQGYIMKSLLLGAALLACATGAFASVGETATNPDPGAAVPAGTGPTWRAPAAILFQNGTFTSQATGGGAAGTEPVSVLTAPDTTLGSNCNNAAFRLADDFTIPAGGATVQKFTVFGYQTQAAPGGSTVSTMTAGFVRIWNGPPNVAGSTVVFGDVTTNRLTATSFSTVWRVVSTTLTNLQRPIMAVEMGSLNIPLTAGTYWLEWGISGSTASGPFCPPNTTVAAANNALQFNVAGATWAAATDGGSLRPLDFPFVVEGVQPQPNITPQTPAGTVNLGTFSANGPISRAFVFTNAASATGSGTVDCQLTGAPAGFTVAPVGAQTVAPGGSVTFTVTGVAPSTPGPFNAGTLTCTVQGVTAPVVYGLVGAVSSAVPMLSPGMLALAVGLLALVGLVAARRHG